MQRMQAETYLNKTVRDVHEDIWMNYALILTTLKG